MLILFESPAGYALFKVKDEKKLAKVDDIYDLMFSSPELAGKSCVPAQSTPHAHHLERPADPPPLAEYRLPVSTSLRILQM
jgi:hypothetical protein